jgi:N-6 DNA Methylase
LVLTTTEALAYVYENTLISKETRSALGTHSTPSFLVDYVVGNLADWVNDIPADKRSVYEPACGHAAFLVSAMRLLAELLPPEKALNCHTPAHSAQKYPREKCCLEVPFGLESHSIKQYTLNLSTRVSSAHLERVISINLFGSLLVPLDFTAAYLRTCGDAALLRDVCSASSKWVRR